MSRLRRLVLSDSWFFITCRVLPWRGILTASEFACLGEVIHERREQVARRCAPFSAPPRLFKRKCQSPPGHAHINPHGIGERPQRSAESAHLCATLLTSGEGSAPRSSNACRRGW